MPTYSYQCKKCEAVADHFHGINAKPRIKCEECGGACKRLIGTGSGIIFKGSGFYETDYKQKSGKPSDKTESKSADVKKTETKSKSSDSKTKSKSTASSKSK
jgi:putative FmdB family regulatory protein